jgi:hypothetical protein
MDVLKPEVDQLALFEQRIRSDGVWCDLSVRDKIVHKMVCKHPQATTAISLCGLIIKPFEKLHENYGSQHCLVCELYDTGRKEAKDKLIVRLNDVLDKQVTPIQTDKETRK